MDNLKDIDYFKNLDEALAGEAGRFAREESFKSGENIFREGDVSKGIYFVNKGIVKVYKTSRDGREQILKLIYPGESFNDITVFLGSMNPASADAVADAKLAVISKENMISLIYGHPELSINIIRSMTMKLKYLTDTIEDLSLKRTQERIAKILISFGNERLSRKTIADLAGTAREVVSRTLRDLSLKNLIKMNGKEIIILDRDKLESMVWPDNN